MLPEESIKIIENFFSNYNLQIDWLESLEQFCKRYNLNIKHLVNILNDPKVIPMLRGKAFEFTVQDYIAQNLPRNKYKVSNPRLNVQIGTFDIDVHIINLETNQEYVAECKLAKKGSFRINKNTQTPYLEVKCMRSRTLGLAAAELKAKITQIPFESWKIHNDQYRSDDFDLVITSIANAFFETDDQGFFVWSPPDTAIYFLTKININSQDDAYNKIYVAKSKHLASNPQNQELYSVKCRRKKCHDDNCGFIPNYTRIYFDINTGLPLPPWFPIENLEVLLES